MLRCRLCGSYGRHEFHEGSDSALDPTVRIGCPECEEYALHDVLEGVDGYLESYELECDQCGYETLWFRPLPTSGMTGVECPECPREPSDELRTISGVGANKAEALIDAGYQTIDDVAEASQDELAEIEGIGKALAARIRADLTTESNHRWHLPKLSVKRERWAIEATDAASSSG